MRKTATFLALVFLLSGCSQIELASHMFKKAAPSSSASQQRAGEATVAHDKLPAPPRKPAEGDQGVFKIGNPYNIAGRWYTPKESYTHVETGIASWYGAKFHGRKTANGEIYDMNQLTAAHRTLQMPSIVRVTNLENGRSLIVRINDRGPFARGRVIDLSRRSAELLGFKKQGTARVRVEVMKQESREVVNMAKRGQSTAGYELALNRGRRPASGTALAAADTRQQQAPQPLLQQASASTPPPAIAPVAQESLVQQNPITPSAIYVQAGSFTVRENAIRLAENLSRHGSADVYPTTINGRQFYRVKLGPIADVSRADMILDTLISSGNQQAMIVVN